MYNAIHFKASSSDIKCKKREITTIDQILIPQHKSQQNFSKTFQANQSILNYQTL